MGVLLEGSLQFESRSLGIARQYNKPENYMYSAKHHSISCHEILLDHRCARRLCRCHASGMFLNLCHFTIVDHPQPAPGPFDNGSTFVLCTDPNLSGTCVFINYRFGQCIDVPVSINDQVSSVATKGSGHSCTLYRSVLIPSPSPIKPGRLHLRSSF